MFENKPGQLHYVCSQNDFIISSLEKNSEGRKSRLLKIRVRNEISLKLFISVQKNIVNESIDLKNAYLQRFPQSHTVSENTTTAAIFLNLFQRLETRIPHKFDTFCLMRFKFLDEIWVHRNKFGFSFGIEIQNKLTRCF